jgi:DNA-directed RNA polymerase subunit RPC12/RpoP
MERKYKWCLFCENTYEDLQTDEFLDDGVCPHCGASVYEDGWDWEEIREVNNYPKEPEKGVIYPQYGFK